MSNCWISEQGALCLWCKLFVKTHSHIWLGTYEPHWKANTHTQSRHCFLNIRWTEHIYFIYMMIYWINMNRTEMLWILLLRQWIIEGWENDYMELKHVTHPYSPMLSRNLCQTEMHISIAHVSHMVLPWTGKRPQAPKPANKHRTCIWKCIQTSVLGGRMYMYNTQDHRSVKSIWMYWPS